MKKRILAALLASAAVLSFAGCSGNTTSSSTPADSSSAADSSAADSSTPADESSSVAEESSAPAAEADDSAKTAGTGITVSESEGKVFNIYAWNEEFKGFFEKYYTVPEGITVNWVINPSDDGVYQDKLDAALQAQATAAADDKVDMFLAEADYIIKYVNSDYTMDVSKIGVSALDTEYKYTVDAATDTRNGQLKGVSFQCCPAALIYRRSIAEHHQIPQFLFPLYSCTRIICRIPGNSSAHTMGFHRKNTGKEGTHSHDPNKWRPVTG